MKSFYIALPANSSAKYFPNNTLSDFQTHLAKPLDLDGQWEAALTEIFLPSSFENVRENITVNIGVMVQTVKSEKLMIESTRNMNSRYADRDIKGGHYSIHDLVESINRKLDKIWALRDEFLSQAPPPQPQSPPSAKTNTHSSPVKFHHYPFTGKVGCAAVTKKSAGRTVKLYIHLRTAVEQNEFDPYRMLGFDVSTYYQSVLEDQYFYSPYTTDVFSGSHVAYLYTDLTAPQMVGDTETTLLRSCSVRNDHVSNTYSETFILPYYLPVTKNRITTIDVSIRDKAGRKIKFSSGLVQLVLHFRKVH